MLTFCLMTSNGVRTEEHMSTVHSNISICMLRNVLREDSFHDFTEDQSEADHLSVPLQMSFWPFFFFSED